MRMIAETYRHDDGPGKIRETILATLQTLETMEQQTGGSLAIRLCSFPPRVGMNGLDADLAGGAIMVQHYEFRPDSESAPILFLTAERDEPWYSHFVREAERTWAAATPWP